MNSPNYVIAAQQTAARLNAPSKGLSISRCVNLNVRKYFVEIDGQRYPRDSVLVNYAENDYVDQYRDLRLFIKKMLAKN